MQVYLNELFFYSKTFGLGGHISCISTTCRNAALSSIFRRAPAVTKVITV